MTRKDYEVIAEALFSIVSDFGADESVSIQLVVEELSDALAKDNPRFDMNKFRKACGVN